MIFDATSSLTQDLDGSYRGAAWDIGADEVPTEFVSTICENTAAGGGCANLDYRTLSTWESAVNSDLTASGTRIFSGTASGTLANGNTVTLYNGATSTGITGTIQATTTLQILIKNIIGTTSPVNVASGTVWQVTSANTWKNSGTADQLGASPIAVAKIDGAWANPDVTVVTVDGWTTSRDNFIKIYTTPTARHNGKWDNGKYRIEVANSAALLTRENYTWIDGIQAYITSMTSGEIAGIDSLNISGESEFKVSNSITRGVTNASGSWFMGIRVCSSNETAYLWNNISYDFKGSGSNLGYGICGTGAGTVGIVVYSYNNTAYNTNIGFFIQDSISTVIAKNNLSYSNDDNYYGTFNASSTNNLSGPTQTDAPGLNPQNAKTVNFVSTSTADFHLADTDTSAKGAGVNLYNDANINVTNDIDSAARPPANVGLNFDIGADQTAVKIYRSIAPGSSAALTTGATNALTISSSTSLATFATALADNIGVGDVIIYNTGGTATGTAFIHGRSSSTVYTVKTASGTAPTAVSADTSWSIYRAYTTLANAEAGTENTGIVNTAIRNFDAWSGGADLVASNTQWNIAAYANGATADTAAVTISGWTTGQQNFIKIYTPTATSEVGTSQRHQGKWDANKYNLYYNGRPLSIYVPNTYAVGLQVGADSGDYGITINNATIGYVHINNNIIKNFGTGIMSQFGSVMGVKIWNNIVYGSGNAVFTYGSSMTGYIYNNSVYSTTGTGSGFYHNAAASSFVLKNNFAQGFASDYNLNATDSSYTNNISKDATSPNSGGTDCAGHSCRNQTVSFVDAANKDFHLAPIDTAALDAGTSSPRDSIDPAGLQNDIIYDIDGQLRRQWDIGADEGSVEYVTSVMQTGGNFSTLSSWEAANQVDLATTSTAVFSLSSASGTIPVNSTLVGLTSGAVASTTVGANSTSTQILLYNIASSTFLSGERIYIKGAATTSNYAILSNAGNPAIATAKIDGAWTNPDTTAVIIDGWTTGPNNYIRVYTTPTARHNGKWDDGKYRLEINSLDGNGISLRESDILIDGVQLKMTGNYNNPAIDGWPNLQNIKINNNIIQNTSTGTGGYNYGISPFTDNAGNIKVYNNIIYGFTDGCIRIVNSTSNKSYVYNNTVYNCGNYGIRDGYGDVVAINNVSYNNTDNYEGAFSASSTNNLSGPTQTDAPGANSRNGVIVSFIDETNRDFHLSPTDTAARNAGTSTILWDSSLYFTQDIDGSYRGAAWDIGADEVPTEFVSTICESTTAGGGCANRSYATLSSWESAVDSDLTASGTRIFSGTASGTLVAGNSVTLYRGATSTGITGTIVATTTSQILLQNIAGTTSPVNVASGTVWQITTANTWRNSGTADQLGASPIAVAKIDGVWASPDTTGLDIDEWTTSYDNYIKIYTTSAARHTGKWDATKYRIERTGGNITGIGIAEEYVWVDGLQIKLTATAGTYWPASIVTPINNVNSKLRISNSIFTGDYTALTGGYASGIAMSGSNDRLGTRIIWNNLFYNFTNDAIVIKFGAGKIYAYNNTIYNCSTGFTNNGGNPVFYLKNNITQNCSNGFDIGPGFFATSSDYNISDIAGDALNATFATTSKVVQFVSTSTADFHLADTDTSAKGQGVNLYNDANINVTNDIDSAARPGPGMNP
ncbi:MAG: hypothetical protein WC659_07170, partial [Patescibacteria group bacterium]